jgi:hypothetical protein
LSWWPCGFADREPAVWPGGRSVSSRHRRTMVAVAPPIAYT